MPCKLTIENDGEQFSLSLKRNLSPKDLDELCQVAKNLLLITTGEYTAEKPATMVAISRPVQTKLGERPVDKINLAEYKEPEKGLRLKMLHYPTDRLAATVKAMRAETGIPLMACKEIVCGNHHSPVFSVETAMKIIENFKAVEVYASMVPADAENAA